MTSNDRAFEAADVIDVMDQAENDNQHLIDQALRWAVHRRCDAIASGLLGRNLLLTATAAPA